MGINRISIKTWYNCIYFLLIAIIYIYNYNKHQKSAVVEKDLFTVFNVNLVIGYATLLNGSLNYMIARDITLLQDILLLGIWSSLILIVPFWLEGKYSKNIYIQKLAFFTTIVWIITVYIKHIYVTIIDIVYLVFSICMSLKVKKQ